MRLTPSFIEQKEKEVIFLIAQRTICQKIALPSIPLQPASSGRKYTLIICYFPWLFASILFRQSNNIAFVIDMLSLVPWVSFV